MKKPVLLVSLFLTTNLIPVLADADTQMANQYLERAINELKAAKFYVEEAKAQQPLHQRVVFHYNRVLYDIDKIESGIQQKFNGPRIQPRIIKPIKGDYITIVGEGK